LCDDAVAWMQHVHWRPQTQQTTSKSRESRMNVNSTHFFTTPRRASCFASRDKTNQNFSPILRFFRTVTPQRMLERKELNVGISSGTAEIGWAFPISKIFEGTMMLLCAQMNAQNENDQN